MKTEILVCDDAYEANVPYVVQPLTEKESIHNNQYGTESGVIFISWKMLVEMPLNFGNYSKMHSSLYEFIDRIYFYALSHALIDKFPHVNKLW